jgi:PleD family two-component response regulator
MMTNGVTTSDTVPNLRASGIAPGASAQKVVIVNGCAEILELLEMALDAGRYDIVFVESNEHAYSQVKRVQPNLVILCVRIEEMDGFQVLSMLKLDEETREIPVLTYTNEHEGQNADENVSDFADGEMMFAPKLALRMN